MFEGTAFLVGAFRPPEGGSTEEGRALVESGVPRGRIWSPKEIELLRMIASNPRVVRAAVALKEQMDARLEDVVEEGAP